MNHSMSGNLKRGLIVAAMVLAALLVALWAVAYMHPTFPMEVRREHIVPREERMVSGDIELYYTVQTVISTINVALLVFLLATYVDIYRRIRSEFTIALIVFSVVLLLYAISSNPLVHLAFGFRAFGLGPFAMLPDLFTCVAVSILVYLSFKY